MEQNVKGTHDLLPLEASNFDAIEGLLKQIARLFGFIEVRPPVIEHSELFIRGVGESSDVVRKEMYTFLDKGNRSITLRPEFTAGIMRLLVQNKTYATEDLPLKYFYLGPVFRYERPQLGRYRQFNQFGVECVGGQSYLSDVEVIALGYSLLCSLGLENVTLKINSLGDDTSRNNYKIALKEYFSQYIDNMCPDCKERLVLNPLRILDCKVPEDQEIVKNAPKVSDFLSKKSEDKFNNVLNSLRELGIPFEIDDTLVRGLDYYSETVFEFHYVSKTGANYGAIGAGGHYDKLVKEVGGPDICGVGFSFGIERLFNVLNDDNLLAINEVGVDIYVMPLGEESKVFALNVANTLRMAGYITDICFDSNKIGPMFKRAEKKFAKYSVIVGENEINNGIVMVKDLINQVQEEVKLQNLVSYFDNKYEQGHEHECHCHEEGHTCECGDHHQDGEHECCCGHHHKGE